MEEEAQLKDRADRSACLHHEFSPRTFHWMGRSNETFVWATASECCEAMEGAGCRGVL
jgi:hypothetical protein